MSTLNNNNLSFTANGSFEFQIQPNGRNTDQHITTVTAQGTFDSGTLSLQFSLDDGTTWSTVTTTGGVTGELTNDGEFNYGAGIADPGHKLYRINLAGATSPSIDVLITDIR